MHFELSPGSSPSKSIPISISPRNMASSTSSLYSNYSSESNSSRGSTCAYPSWPTGPSLEYRSTPSSYISDADLFGEDYNDEFACPFLEEAPAPPRVPQTTQAFTVLQPLYAQKKPKSERRSSGRKQRRTSKPMTPISESPEQVDINMLTTSSQLHARVNIAPHMSPWCCWSHDMSATQPDFPRNTSSSAFNHTVSSCHLSAIWTPITPKRRCCHHHASGFGRNLICTMCKCVWTAPPMSVAFRLADP
ncbi:hypothetical protein EJ02DRAFT_513862 [Clathrospora elynae]|uniref:Uncharacterized protein n=1 Tax=Clathrospora elynae TaxID=706981 RepID=A0A6A5SQF5_9PLEO|nr:hypothetical protein EJ02DRAFT_513862 [Clathrospora elynae]